MGDAGTLLPSMPTSRRPNGESRFPLAYAAGFE